MTRPEEARQAIRREDYQAYPWRLTAVELHFDIQADFTEVKAELSLAALDGRSGSLDLDGAGQELLDLRVNGRVLAGHEFQLDGRTLRIHQAPADCRIQTRVRIQPALNKSLEGFYAAGDFLLTQCEPEGFRKITWFPDRPDVMSQYTVTITADTGRYPVLLSNGNPVASGTLANGRHWQRWVDPFPKPSYLFALVAGDLAFVEDHFRTRSGRDVTLRVYVERENLDRCGHALESLINAMRWDEQRFGLEYDLDIYNIVATNDFNMGAMENKSLNIFNSRYVLARPDTATDSDYQGIEGVIGHEYFHNWTGNRVTCRDWFQLTLKEGLTVFRDEEFSADMQSRAWKRIQDVRDLRSRQFPEDAGPMAHAIRPDQYLQINNFYTSTVYQKGAAVIRLYHTLLGEAGFQKGMRLYFERHDGQAVTCDDFLAAMADANAVDLTGFARWYSQSGTPEVTVRIEYQADLQRCVVHLSQHTQATPDQADKQALVIPVAIGLLDSHGRELPLRLQGSAAAPVGTLVLRLEQARQSFVIEDIPEAPVASVLRDFSAPVKLSIEYSDAELALLIAHDQDAFARWEAAQLLAQRSIFRQLSRWQAGQELQPGRDLENAFRGLLQDRNCDPTLLAEALDLPDEEYLAELLESVDVEGLYAAREFVRRSLAEALAAEFRARYAELNDGAAYRKDAASAGRRSLRNICLGYLACLQNGEQLALDQLAASDNMTDTLAALKVLALNDLPAADTALDAFAAKWQGDALVMDKWFSLHAQRPGLRTLERVRALMQHPDFKLTNPNKVRSLIGVYCMLNPTAFHRKDGQGYAFLADQVLALDKFNSMVAARMITALIRWPRYDAGRAELMRRELERVMASEGLSADVYEIVSKALA